MDGGDVDDDADADGEKGKRQDSLNCRSGMCVCGKMCIKKIN